MDIKTAISGNFLKVCSLIMGFLFSYLYVSLNGLSEYGSFMLYANNLMLATVILKFGADSFFPVYAGQSVSHAEEVHKVLESLLQYLFLICLLIIAWILAVGPNEFTFLLLAFAAWLRLVLIATLLVVKKLPLISMLVLEVVPAFLRVMIISSNDATVKLEHINEPVILLTMSLLIPNVVWLKFSIRRHQTINFIQKNLQIMLDYYKISLINNAGRPALVVILSHCVSAELFGLFSIVKRFCEMPVTLNFIYTKFILRTWSSLSIHDKKRTLRQEKLLALINLIISSVALGFFLGVTTNYDLSHPVVLVMISMIFCAIVMGPQSAIVLTNFASTNLYKLWILRLNILIAIFVFILGYFYNDWFSIAAYSVALPLQRAVAWRLNVAYN